MEKKQLIKMIENNTKSLINTDQNYQLKDQINSVRDHIIDKINDLTKDELKKYLDDQELSFYCVNEDYFLIGYYQCEKFCNDQFFNMFDLLNQLDETGCIEYMFSKDENNNSDFNSEKFVNMFAYCIGSHILEYK